MKRKVRTLLVALSVMGLLVSCGGKESKQEVVTQTVTETVVEKAPVEQKSEIQLEEGQIKVQITDADGDFTNLRNSPNGEIMYKLPTSSSYELIVEEPTKEWWQIVDNKVEKLGKKGKTVELPEGIIMVHSSVLSVQTNNEEGKKLSLRKAPNKDAEKEYSFSKSMEFRPIDIDGEWVKVSTQDNKRTGWIKAKYLK